MNAHTFPTSATIVPRRADALDALRGFAILTMALSGMIPFGMHPGWTEHLPTWMYHAQVPPPEHRFNPDLPGLTWVDLVFPFFLFSMGAAMPLALSRRLEQGESAGRLTRHAVKRGLLLLAFALYVDHIVPARLKIDSDVARWLWGLLGFGLLFPALTRLPAQWPPWRHRLIRFLGWGGMLAFVIALRYRDGGGLALAWHSFDDALKDLNIVAGRSDIIIVVLANTVVTGSLLWLILRHNAALRIGFMLAVVALRLSHDVPGWVKSWWDWQPVPSLYRLYFQQYLLIVLPGTLAGDLILDWLRHSLADRALATWRRMRLLALVALAVGIHALLLAGLQARWLPWTSGVALLLCAVGAVFVLRPRSPLERLLAQLFGWGALWLIVGLLFEPYEGGIKKDHPTCSYYLVTSGLACFALLAFTVCIERLRGQRWLGLLICSGQNPMIAYAGVRNFIAPAVHLAGAGYAALRAADSRVWPAKPTDVDQRVLRWFAAPWPGVLWGAIRTTLLALVVSVFTRLKLHWRT